MADTTSVLERIGQEDIQTVDFRFTDLSGRWQHIGFAAAKVTNDQVFGNLDGYYIMNYWPTALYENTGHIPGALNIPHTELPDRLDDVRAASGDGGVVVYCMRGPRARMGESTLLSGGFEEVRHLDGGLAAWRQAGLPVEPPVDPVD